MIQDGVPAVTEKVAPGSPVSRAVGGAATVLSVGQFVATCSRDGNCDAAGNMLAVDLAGCA